MKTYEQTRTPAVPSGGPAPSFLSRPTRPFAAPERSFTTPGIAAQTAGARRLGGVLNRMTIQRKPDPSAVIQRNGDGAEKEEPKATFHVCTRQAFTPGASSGASSGPVGTHKYFYWPGGTHTGMGSAPKESGPSVDKSKAYTVPQSQMERIRKTAESKKAAADSKFWMPYSNDCHRVVDDTLTSHSLDSAREMTRSGMTGLTDTQSRARAKRADEFFSSPWSWTT